MSKPAQNMRKITLENGKILRFDAGTSDEDIGLALKGYRQEEMQEFGEKKPFGMDYRQGAVGKALGLPHEPPTKDIDLEGRTPEPEQEGEGYLMERAGIDVTSMAAGYAGAKLGFDIAPTQYKPLGALLGGATASGIGAFGGTYIQHGIQEAYNSPLSDVNASQLLLKASKEGGEAAVTDLLMGGLFQSVAVGWRYMKSMKGRADVAKVQAMLKSDGSTLSLGQVLDDTVVGAVVRGTEELLRGAAWTRGSFTKLNKTQDTQFFKYVNNVAEAMTGRATKDLKPGAFGRYVQIVATKGERLHSEASNLLFSELDRAVPYLTKMEPIKGGVPTGTATLPSGKLLRQTPQMVGGDRMIKVLPVDVKHIRTSATKAVKELQKLGLPETAAEGLGVLSNMAKGVDSLSFAEAHKLLSGLKRMQRSGKLKGDPGSVELGGLIKMVDDSFTAAGDHLGGDITKQYKAARDFYKKGKQAFNNKMITKMLEMDPSKLGTFMAKDASIEDVRRIRTMVKEASRQKGSNINYQETMRSITYGTVKELMPRGEEGLIKSGIFKIAKDPKMEDRLVSIIGQGHVETIKKSTAIIERLLAAHGEKGALTSRQLGAVSAYAVGGAAASVASGSMIPALVAFFAVPAVASKLFTSPKFVNAMVSFEKNPIGSAARRRLMTKMALMKQDAEKDPAVEKMIANEIPTE